MNDQEQPPERDRTVDFITLGGIVGAVGGVLIAAVVAYQVNGEWYSYLGMGVMYGFFGFHIGRGIVRRLG